MLSKSPNSQPHIYSVSNPQSDNVTNLLTPGVPVQYNFIYPAKEPPAYPQPVSDNNLIAALIASEQAYHDGTPLAKIQTNCQTTLQLECRENTTKT